MGNKLSHIIEGFAINESYMTNNIADNQAESILDKMLLEMETSRFKIPFSEQAVHLFKINESYNIPYRDMVRLCKSKGYSSFLEATDAIAETYNINRNNICVYIDEESGCIDKTVERISDAIDCSMKIFYHDTDYDDAEVSFMQIFGEGKKCCEDDIIDDEDDDIEAISEEIPKAETKECDGSKLRKIHKESLDYDIHCVNVYNKDFDYYVEMYDLEKYMDCYNISSIKEAVWNVAKENDIDDWKRINILCESREKMKSHNTHKGKAHTKRKNKTTLILIARSTQTDNEPRKLKIGWVDTAAQSKGIKKHKK